MRRTCAHKNALTVMRNIFTKHKVIQFCEFDVECYVLILCYLAVEFGIPQNCGVEIAICTRK